MDMKKIKKNKESEHIFSSCGVGRKKIKAFVGEE